MVDALAAEYGFELRRCLTGFKYIGDIITELSDAGQVDRFISASKESYGYLSGDTCATKDAVNASLLICQMAQDYKLRGMNLAQAMRALYEKHGLVAQPHRVGFVSGRRGCRNHARHYGEAARTGSSGLPAAPLKPWSTTEGGVNGLPSANVVEFDVEGGNKVIVRPVAPSPKSKLYVFAKDADRAAADALLDAHMRPRAAELLK